MSVTRPQDAAKPSLKRSTLTNLGLSAGARATSVVLQLSANIVLARNLSSSDYSIVSFAQIFITLLALLSEFGLSSAAIQDREVSQKMMSTGFTLRLLLGLAAFFLALLIAPLGASTLGEPVVADVMKLLAFGFLINVLSFVPSVTLLRALDYRKLVASQFAAALVNAGVTITMALHGYGYWSIAVAMIASTITSVAYLNFVKPLPLKLSLDRACVVHYARFGSGIYGYGLLTIALLNLDNFVVGMLAGPVALGYYAIAFSWGSKICELMATVVNSVLFPTFARIQNDAPRLRMAFRKSLQLIAFCAVCGYAVLFIVSRDLLLHLLGAGTEKWMPALGALQFLCLYGIVRAPLEAAVSVVMALGHNSVLVRANILAVAVMATLIYPALSRFGIDGVALVVTLSYAAQYLVFAPTLKRHLGLGWRDFVQPVLPALVAGGLVLPVMAGLDAARLWHSGQLRLWAGSAVSTLAFILIYGVITRGVAYREVYETLVSRSRRA